LKTTLTPLTAIIMAIMFSFSSCDKEDTEGLILTDHATVDSVSVYVNTGKADLTPPVQIIDFGNSIIQKHKSNLEYLNLDKITYSLSEFKSSAPQVIVRGEIYFALAGSNIEKFVKIGVVQETDLKQVAAYPDVEQTITLEGVNMPTLMNYIKEGKKVSFMIYGHGDQPFETNFNLRIRTLYTVNK